MHPQTILVALVCLAGCPPVEPGIALYAFADSTVTEEQTIVLAADAVGIDPTAVLLYDNDVLVAELTDGRPYHYSWTVTADDEGEHVWTAHARFSDPGARSARLMVSNALVFQVDLGGPVRTSAGSNAFYNSVEPGCDGSDPTVLWCDDFEDGSWYFPYTTDPGTRPEDDGWRGWSAVGTSDNGTPDETGNGNFARCGGEGVGGTDCTAIKGTAGRHKGQAHHALLRPVDEVYLRLYYKAEAGSQWNQEKFLGFGDKSRFNAGTFDFALFKIEESRGDGTGELISFSGNCTTPMIGPYWGIEKCIQDLDNQLHIEPGHWYYIEVHVKLNDVGQSNGALGLWMDDCGEDGLACTGPGTQRMNHTGLDLRADSTRTVNNIGTVYLTNWSATDDARYQSRGDRRYDQIVAATRRIGPMGATP